MDLTPKTLPGRFVSLEPLSERHARDLLPVMRDEEVCRFLSIAPAQSMDDVLSYIRDARGLMSRGESLVFAIVRAETGAAVGATRLLDVRPKDRQVEIGGTFLSREVWRTPANTEAKYLFLRHCFESLGCVRVALKTDGRNLRAQEAIARLGAVREGVLRKHMNVRGYQRDTVYYSILDSEWPGVRAALLARLTSSGP